MGRIVPINRTAIMGFSQGPPIKKSVINSLIQDKTLEIIPFLQYSNRMDIVAYILLARDDREISARAAAERVERYTGQQFRAFQNGDVHIIGSKNE